MDGESNNFSVTPQTKPTSKSSFGIFIVIVLLLLLSSGLIYFLFRIKTIDKQISDLKVQSESFQQALDNGFLSKQGDRIIGDTNGNSTTLNLDNSTLAAKPNQNATVKLGDSSGATSFVIQNSNGIDVASLNSIGNFGLDGRIICTNCIALGSETTGNYVKSLLAGDDIAIFNGTGEGTVPTIFNISTLDSVTGRGSTTNHALTINSSGNALTFSDPNAVLAFNAGAGRLYDSSGNLFYNGTNLTSGGALPAGLNGQTLRNNGASWFASSNLYNDGTNVGIGTTTPSQLLSVGTSNQLTVDGSGNLTTAGLGTYGNIDVGKHLHTNPDIVWAGGPIPQMGNVDTISMGAANTGTPDVEAHYLSAAHRSRIRQDGNLTQIKMYFASKPASLTAFYIEVWRENGTKFDRISQENILSKISGGTTNTITLNTVAAKEGDYLGYGWTASSDPGNFLTSVNSTVVGGSYKTVSAPTATTYDWLSQIASNNYVPILSYMPAPMMVFLGDSIMAGVNDNWTFNDPTKTTNIKANTPWYVYQALGPSFTYQNMAYAGKNSNDGVANFTTDVINLKPKMLVLEGYVNDIGAMTQAQMIANYTTMLDSATSNNIIPVVMAILPWTNGTDAQMIDRDSRNVALKTLVQSYPTAIWADASSYVGKYRSTGPVDNLWDIVYGSSTDGIHYTIEGHRKIAQAYVEAISKIKVSGAMEAGELKINGSNMYFGGGSVDNYLQVLRTTAYQSNGSDLVIKSGAATSAATDKNGGGLILSSGLSTGTGTSTISFQTAAAGASGTTDHEPLTKMTITGAGLVGIGTVNPNRGLHTIYGLTVSTLDFGPGIGSSLGIFSGATSGNTYMRIQAFTAGEGAFGNVSLQTDGGLVGIGTAGPDRKLDVLDASNPQLRLTYTDGSVYTDFQTTSTGGLTITPSATASGVNIASANVSGTTTAAALSVSGNSLTTGTGLYAASSTLSGGSLVDLAVTGTAAASNTQKALNISTSGANAGATQTTYGSYISNTHTGTTSTNIGLYTTASGGTNNYGLIVDAGNVGVGTTTPTYALDVAQTVKAGTALYGNTRMLSFDGNDDNVNFGNITELNSVANFTMSTWVKQNVVPANSYIFDRNPDNVNRVSILTYVANTRLSVYLTTSGDFAYLDTYPSYITAGRWHHLSLVYDGTQAADADKLKLYIDGVYVAFTGFTGAIPATTANLVGANATIGEVNNSLNGGAQDFRFYSSSLSASNIATIYQGGTYTTNMVHQYKLMEGSGIVATDTGSNVLNGTISGATWSTTNNTGIQTDFGRGALTLAPNTTNAKDGLWFGYDANMYRSAASVITSDSKLDPASLNLQVKAGIPADADIVGGASSGDIVLDTSNSRIYVREGATWKYAAIAAGFQIPTAEVYSYDFTSKSFDISKPIKAGDLLIPFADETMSDGAMHGLYTTFDSVKQTMFDSFAIDFNQLADSYLSKRSDTALTKIDNLELSLNSLSQKVDGLSGNANFISSLKNSLTISTLGDLTAKGALIVNGNAKFGGDVEIAGHTILSGDSVGQAVFAAGESNISVKYTKRYNKQPTVFVNANGKDVQFKVTGESVDGFTIELINPAAGEIELNWLVVGTK